LTDIPEARPSATVVVAREGADDVEILMVRRHAEASFGNAYAFPGGVLEAADARVHDACQGISAERANQLLQTPDGLDYYSAAIRELFEETGVLLAESHLSKDELDIARQRLNEGVLDWQEFLGKNSLQLCCDQLTYFSYWITPDSLQKRYSTRFFFARLPPGQRADHCGIELTDSTWMSAKKLLLASRADTMTMHFPTLNTIKSLSQHDTLEAISNWCAAREQAGVECIYPNIVGGRPVIR
jgi:8-oxo-dGTP pyrophosphatase MutT (NUDIX family)